VPDEIAPLIENNGRGQPQNIWRKDKGFTKIMLSYALEQGASHDPARDTQIVF
jgi:hypothetical protein